MSKLHWARRICFAVLVCAATAITLPAQIFTSLHSFDGTDGELPTAALIQATDGNLYGTTSAGGANGAGTIFKITPRGTLTVLYSFCSEAGCTDGANPYGGLIQATDGNFYGTTEGGGANTGCFYGGCGTVFRFTPGGALTTLDNLCSSSSCGNGPRSGLIQASDGNFYGTTQLGGTNSCELEGTNYGCGTIYRITPAGILTILYSFCSRPGCADGNYPTAALVQASDGNFYGTSFGGAGEDGTIFRITPTGPLTTLQTFDGSNGDYPYAGMIQATNGNLYGTTGYGGADGYGTVYQLTLGGALTTLYSFCSVVENGRCTDGFIPLGELIQGTDGNFYGTTGGPGYSYCAESNCGSVFRITPGGTLTTLHIFDATNGAVPWAGVVQDTSGKLYGTTIGGGADSDGTVFSLIAGLGPFVETQPTSGPVGRRVKILGNTLEGVTSVSFNGTAAAFTIESSSLITTTVPAGATTGPVEVVTPKGTLTSNIDFRVIP